MGITSPAMAEAAITCEFDNWLKDTLVKLDTDDEVFSPYIKSILEGEETTEEKQEALQEMLSEITESGIDELCNDILKKWNLNLEAAAKEEVPKEKQIEMDEKIAKIMESQAVSVVVPKTRSQADQKLKAAILAQYSQVSDGEETESDGEIEASGTGSSGIDALLKNTNLEDVAADVQAKREADKAASAIKKEKDKEDRSKQKSKDQDRKDGEKKRTQKGERRR